MTQEETQDTGEEYNPHPEVEPPVRYKSIEEIVAIEDTPTQDVWVPAWETYFKVKGLTKNQQLEIRKAATVRGEIDEDAVQRGMLFAAVLEPKIEEHQMGQLWEKQAGAIDKVLKVVLQLSGMQPEDVKAKEARFPS